MGRRRVEMKRIKDRSSRNVTFTKRTRGLFKKASELSILCDVDIALLVFSSSGKLYEFYSHDNSLENFLRCYQHHFGRAETYDDITSKTNGSFGDTWQQSNAENLLIAQSHLGRLDIERLNMVELVQLEKQLDAALTKTRSRKIQLMQQSIMPFCQQPAYHCQELRMLRQENRLLEEQILMNSIEMGNLPHHVPHQATLKWMSKT